MNPKFFLYITIILLTVFAAKAQVVYPGESAEEEEKQQVLLSDEIILDDSFFESIPMYEKLLQFNPKSSKMNYKLGFVYLHSIVEKGKAIEYIEKAVEYMSDDNPTDNAPIEVYLYLGRAYRMNMRYKEALTTLVELKAMVTDDNMAFIDAINKEIALCNESLIEQQNAHIDKKESKKQIRVAENFLDDENFSDAIPLYLKMLEANPLHSSLNFKLGFCYLQTADQKDKAIDYLQIAVDNVTTDKKRRKENAPLEAYFYLARAYRMEKKHKEAMFVLQFLMNVLPEKEVEFSVIVMKEIEMAENVLVLMENPVEIVSDGLEMINSRYSDHSPVFPADESAIIFTSRRKPFLDSEKAEDGQYYEDVYTSEFTDSLWTAPQQLKGHVNTNGHEATVGLSVDGQELFIYKPDDNGSIWVSTLDGDEWALPKKLSNNVNTRFRETHASLSANGKQLYFTSDRKGGFGGLDVYMSDRLHNGTWGKATNLGETINTPFNEEGPYIHPDGISLFFSSEGHNSIGGLDIFKAEYNDKDSTWSEPKNIGFPINTVENDAFYIPTPDGKRAYYITQQEEGSGYPDIYKITLPKSQAKPLTIMSGVVNICDKLLPDVKIFITDSLVTDTFGIYRPNTKSGKYLFVLNKGNSYLITYTAPGAMPYTEKLVINQSSQYRSVVKNIQLISANCDIQDIVIEDDYMNSKDVGYLNNGTLYDELIEMKTILFPFANASNFRYYKDLDKIADYLLRNPLAIIEIGGYADSRGSSEYNRKLTELRASTVKTFLLKKGAKSAQLVINGYGEENPIAKNINSNGTYNYIAMKYNRRIEFKVIKQGKLTLYIKSVVDIPEPYRIETK